MSQPVLRTSCVRSRTSVAEKSIHRGKAWSRAISYRLIHLPLVIHGAPTSPSTISFAFDLARAFNASVDISRPHLDVRVPSYSIASSMLAELASRVERAAEAKATELVALAKACSDATYVPFVVRPVTEFWPAQNHAYALHGRACDLCVLETPHDNVDRRLWVEAWLFGVGRPCLLYPSQRNHTFIADRCVIAWDGGRAAARAVGDALPLLKRATKVMIVAADGEREVDTDATSPLVDYLAAHHIVAENARVDVGGKRAGVALIEYAQTIGGDLLIMGAYGHSRLRQFVLGGATRDVLEACPIPVLMSH